MIIKKSIQFNLSELLEFLVSDEVSNKLLATILSKCYTSSTQNADIIKSAVQKGMGPRNLNYNVKSIDFGHFEIILMDEEISENQGEDDLKKIQITPEDFSTLTFNALRSADIKSLKDLEDHLVAQFEHGVKTTNALGRIRHLGKKGKEHLNLFITKNGLRINANGTITRV